MEIIRIILATLVPLSFVNSAYAVQVEASQKPNSDLLEYRPQLGESVRETIGQNGSHSIKVYDDNGVFSNVVFSMKLSANLMLNFDERRLYPFLQLEANQEILKSAFQSSKCVEFSSESSKDLLHNTNHLCVIQLSSSNLSKSEGVFVVAWTESSPENPHSLLFKMELLTGRYLSWGRSTTGQCLAQQSNLQDDDELSCLVISYRWNGTRWQPEFS